MRTLSLVPVLAVNHAGDGLAANSTNYDDVIEGSTIVTDVVGAGRSASTTSWFAVG